MTWANSVRVLKQEFQAWGSIIGSVIINALKPFVQALSKVMLKVISFTKTVADALGAIFGWTIEISGGGATVDGMEDIADGVGDIGDNADSSNKKAQKLKKTLLSIDEIHALDDNSDSGSGGGSGSGGSGGGGAGSGVNSSLKKTDGLLEKYKSSIKDLYSLGKYIGDALASAMESIDWKKIYQKADNFGKGLADFLNGLISPRLFYDLGATIAGSLNTALHFLNSFGTTFDWTNFGLSIANGINGFFENFDFALLAKTINAWVQGIYTMLTTAIKNVSWKDVLKGITDFLSNLDIKTVEIIVGTLLIKKIISLKLGSVALAFIGKSLSKAIAQAIASKIGFELVEGAGIGTAIMQAFKTILSHIAGQTIIREKTLIVFDEVQLCERALTSLKYFCEDAPEYHIIVAGSLLGVAVNRTRFSFPVGKVDMKTLYPMDMEEFMLAMGEEQLVELIKKCFQTDTPMPAALHDAAMQLYRQYLVVGGMPECVMQFIQTKDYILVRNTQNTILASYLNDMSKYNNLSEIKKTRLAYDNITVQLSKKNTRFQYKLIKKGGRASEFENAIEWLCLSGIVSQVYKVEQVKKPLENYRDIDAFKIYVSDLGLLCAKKELLANDILYMVKELDDFKGGMAENYVNVQLSINGYHTYYWESARGAEIDFVIQREGKLIPIEVKSADNTRAKSLKVYMDTYEPDYAIKLSAKNFAFEDRKKIVPLYAAFCI